MNPVSFLTFVFLSPESSSPPVALAVSESVAGPLRVFGMTLNSKENKTTIILFPGALYTVLNCSTSTACKKVSSSY